MPDPSSSADAFASLFTFDATAFEPPAWARTGFFAPGSSGAGPSGSRAAGTGSNDGSAGDGLGPGHGGDGGDGGDDGDDGDDDDDFEDAREEFEGVEAHGELGPETVRFTVPEMRKLLARALELKAQGNARFTAAPRDLAGARAAYEDALGALPDVPAPPSAPAPGAPALAAAPAAPGAPATPATSDPAPAAPGIVEVSDAEAAAIEAAAASAASAASAAASTPPAALDTPEPADERAAVEAEIREATKAVHQNLGAVFAALGDDAAAVKACTQALAIDPDYVKALVRRAAANERIASWGALAAAQEDHTRLLALLPGSSPQRPLSRRALQTLPRRIAEQQDKEKDEMLGKLKELGNGILGRFGLSTDMFQFEKGDGGGYSMKFGQ